MTDRFLITLVSLSLLIILSCFSACGGTGNGTSGNEDETPTTTDLEITSSTVIENPNSVLSALVTVETSELSSCYVEFGTDETYGRQTSSTESSLTHDITVVQMRELTDYHLRIVAVDQNGLSVYSEDMLFTTAELPSDIPGYTVTSHDTDAVQPGVTFFGPGISRQGGTASPYYLGVDETGQVVWYYRLQGETGHFNDRSLFMLEDGDLLITTPDGFSVITIGGDTVSEFTPQQAGYSIFHHEAIALPNGRFMTLSQEVEELDVDWSTEPIEAIGDVIVELDASGNVTWEWSAFDHLDTTRYPNNLSLREDQRGQHDWTHANAVFYVEADNSVLLSVRHQNWIVKIDRETGDVIWILGDEGDFDLTNFDRGAGNEWFYAQHSPQIQADGTLLLYDNGNERPDTVTPSLYSRAVMFRLDETAMEAEQIWAFTTDYYTGSLGDANGLSNGNVLVCAGGPDGQDAPAQVIEVTSEQPAEPVWTLEMDGNNVYRAVRLDSLYL